MSDTTGVLWFSCAKGCPVEVQGHVSISGRYENLTAAIEVGKGERAGTDAVEGIVQSTK